VTLLIGVGSLSVYGQDAAGLLGPLCDAETGEPVWVEKSDIVKDCCWVLDGDEFIKWKDENGNPGCPELKECEDCCTFTINSNRNGINNVIYYSNFSYGPFTANSWTDFKTAYQFQGGTVIETCPDIACNVTTVKLCGLQYNLPLTYLDQDGNTQEIITTCTPDNRYRECRVGKSAYALWDNTGTSFNQSYTFLVTYDNGSTEEVTQPVIASGGFSGQLNYWSSPDGFGVNPFCEYQSSCNILPNGCGGLDPPPSEVLESGTDISTMRWRYLNVKCCFTEKIPVSIEIIDSSFPRHVGRFLDLIVFYGREIEYEVCGSCGKDGTWYYYGSKEEVLEQDMPICTRPCGFDFPSLSSPSCTFTYFDGCDQNNLDGDGNPKAIIVQYVDCGDGEVVNAIFEITNDGSLLDYDPILVDDEPNIDDCNGGIIVAPEPEIPDDVTEGIFTHCANGQPVTYCIFEKSIKYYQNGKQLTGEIEFHECCCPPDDEEDTTPIGDQTICASRKLGADFASNATGSLTHTTNSLYDTNGPIIAWVGIFTVVDATNVSHTFTNGQTVTGMASGATVSESFTGSIHWSDGTNEYRCNVTNKLISAQANVQ